MPSLYFKGALSTKRRAVFLFRERRAPRLPLAGDPVVLRSSRLLIEVVFQVQSHENASAGNYTVVFIRRLRHRFLSEITIVFFLKLHRRLLPRVPDDPIRRQRFAAPVGGVGANRHVEFP